MPRAPRTHIYFLLDRTGSMASLTADVIGGFNGFVAEQQAAGDSARLTLVQFDSQDPFEVLVDGARLADVPELTAATFQPRGSTPLLDSTGRLIAWAAGRAEQRRILGKRPEQVLVVTFTDGEENASREFTHAQIAQLVQAKEAEGWTFAFLGAGLDAYAEARGHRAGNVQAFAPDAAGARLAFDDASRATTAYRRKLAAGLAAHEDDFFEGGKRAEADRRRRHDR